MKKLQCEKCKSSHIVKCGLRKSIQRYKCQCCNTKFQIVYKREMPTLEKKSQALELYLEGLGLEV